MSDNVKKDAESMENPGHVRYQWIVAFLANIPVFTYGLQAGWVSPMAPLLQSEDSPLGEPLTTSALSWVASVLFLAAAVSAPAYSYVADKFGRRVACLLISLPHAITWLMTIFAKNVAVLIAARAFSGIAAGGAFCIIPMYVKELSDDRVRGATGSLGMVIQSFGFLVIYVMGAFMDYYTIVYAVIALPLLHSLLLFMVPESPSFLVKVGKYKEASKNIAWLRGLEEKDVKVEHALDKLKEERDANSSIEKLSIKAVFTHKPWRIGVIISLVLHGVRGLGGSLVILSYASVILEKSGVTVNPLIQTMTIPAVMIVGIVISLMIVDKLGRKPLLILGCSVMGVSLAVLGAITHVEPTDGSWSWVPITALMAAIFGYGIGVLSIPYIIMAEIFNLQVRATLLGYIAVYIWIVMFVHVQTFALIEHNWGIYVACYIYTVINTIGVVYTVFFVPETKGKNINEIESKLEMR